MTLLLDTESLPAKEREAAFRSTLYGIIGECEVDHLATEGEVRARMETWQLGPVSLFVVRSRGFRVLRTDRQTARGETAPLVAFGVPRSGPARFSQSSQQHEAAPGGVVLVDMSLPYEISLPPSGDADSVLVPVDQLGLPVDVVRRAVGSVPDGPLRRLVTHHLTSLSDNAPQLATEPAAAAVGESTLELVRALVATLAPDQPPATAALTETLLTRIRAYVRAHLTEPDLHAARIAAAHHISVRQLYKLCAQAGFRLEQWIINQRLQGAREDLARTVDGPVPVAHVARRWGFSDPAHFARRFRDAYGLTPREWRQLAREAGGG